MAKLAEDNLIIIEGKGRGTKYLLSPSYLLLSDIDVEAYFSLEQDERQIKSNFNLSLMSEIIAGASFFTTEEQLELTTLQMEFGDNVDHL